MRRTFVTWDQLTKNCTDVTDDWEAMKRYREKVGIEIH